MSALLKTLQSQLQGWWLIPSYDRFQGESIIPHDNWLQWICGFTGSNGLAVIGKIKKALLTDSRYTLQAKIECKDFDIVDYSFKNLVNWIIDQKEQGDVFIDPSLFSFFAYEKLVEACKEVSLKVVAHPYPFQNLWENRPFADDQRITILDDQYTGQSVSSKLTWLRSYLETHQLDGFLITACDNVSWLLNIRSDQVPYSPVVQGYVYIDQNCVVFISNDTKKPEGLCVDWISFQDVGTFLSNKPGIIGYDPLTTTLDMLDVIKNSKVIKDPITLQKATKNGVQQEGMRICHHIDGKSLTNYITWLKDNYQGLTEWDVVETLESQRRKNADYQGASFASIVGFGDHGAIVHYHPHPKSPTYLKNGPLLIDSGGQYFSGTTDVTRTLYLGKTPPAVFKAHWTLVLKCHIALAMAIFPKGTTGRQLDVLARQFLWRFGLNFGHGTGHGVGSYLNVHEGPQSISPKAPDVPLLPGMVVSNEPGYYLEGQYGIRHENLVMVQEHPEYKDFLYFETLTAVPFDLDCLDESLMTTEEHQWLEAYHRYVDAI